MARGNQISLDNALEDIRGTTIRQRADGLRNLKSIFDGSYKADNLNLLNDKAFHKILEDLFRVVVEEKKNLTSAKKTAKSTSTARIQASADAVRIVLQVATFKLKAKSVEAVIDHITQTLPNADDEYCEPIAQHYLRALGILLERNANVEHLKPDTWFETVDFCLIGINRYLDDNEGEPTGLSRSHSLGTSNGRTQSQAGSVSRQNVEDLLQILSHLVSAQNAPVVHRCDLIATTIIGLLSSQGSSVSQLQKVAFSILNAVLSSTREDRGSLSKTIAQEAVPIICRFWQGKSVAKDEMLSSVRDEMLILLFLSHLHLERIVREGKGDIVTRLNDLLEVVRAEYARRLERDQLQLEDIDMADLGADVADITPFQLYDFRLNLHNTRAERNWANLLIIGILERLVSLGDEQKRLTSDAVEDDTGKHPRKRQRTAQSTDRLLGPLRSEDQSVRLAGLQILPFAVQQSELGSSALIDILDQLCVCAADKRGNIASWAFLAIASCTHQHAAVRDMPVDWLQLWHAGARAVTYSSTCRAAGTQLHAMLATGVIQYHDVGEDVEAMITAADISGPAILCDSSIFLMMHLLHVRVTEVPSASLTSCSHITRWILSRWNPAERSITVQSSAHVSPSQVVDLLRTTLGLPRLATPNSPFTVCDSLAQAWQLHLTTQDTLRYLLLLEDDPLSKKFPWCSLCPSHAVTNIAFRVLDTSRFQLIRKLIMELISPKLSDLMQHWRKFNEDGPIPVSKDSFRRSIDACITLLLLMPFFADSSSKQLQNLQEDLQSLTAELFKLINGSSVRDSRTTQTLIDTLIICLQPHLPACRSTELAQFACQTQDLQTFLVQVADILSRRRMFPESATARDGYDMMDLDDEFGTQQSNGQVEGQSSVLPRHDLALASSSSSFYMDATCRMMFLGAMNDMPDVSGSIPSAFVERLLSLTKEEFLSCRGLLSELFSSDLMINENDATQVIKYLGETILGSDEYDRCEIALSICLKVLSGLSPLWVRPDGSKLTVLASDLYRWFVTTALPKDIFSPAVLKGIAELLFLLMRLEDENVLSSPSPRTILFQVFQKGNISVQFYIGNQIPGTFDLYTLKAHDEYFCDLLEVLPSDQERIEGLAFRSFILAKLAFRWPNLLRRCIYHIFEIPGRVKESSDHAARCLSKVSTELKLNNTQELFKLFAPQLLYTWLDSEPIEEIPYDIFGFQSLEDLLVDAQEEATGLMIMRGQDKAVDGLSELLGVTKIDLLQKTFSKVMAYSVAHDTQLGSTATTNTPTKRVPSETLIRNCLGDDIFFERVNLHFADIVALLFNTTEYESAEKYFKKQPGFAYAAEIMEEIKSKSFSKAGLPVDQQPFFKAKYLAGTIRRLCSRTEHEPTNLFTPSLVTFLARKILRTIHPALGSLHACSVLRKLRVLISLSGETSVKGYPLEMLLHSVRPFIIDPECANDAIGIVQYLITRGSAHLLESPPFVAGIALSIFGSLRVFLRSVPASTTQESQYKETMSKVQKFHVWMGNYVTNYNSPSLSSRAKSSFRALVQTASKIGSVGNAEVGTAESNLLYRLLEDEKVGRRLLSSHSRELAFQMLCSEFQVPTSFRIDVLGSDDLAIENAAVVWKSCKGESVSKQYLSWAARVLGRSFAASGHIHQELLQESTLSQTKDLRMAVDGQDSSETYILSLLQTLTLGHDRRTAGLAESAFRVIVTHADEDLVQICHRVLPISLNEASNWPPYHTPPSDILPKEQVNAAEERFATDAILESFWARDLAIFLALSVLDDPLLPTLVPILREVPKFADRAFPYILHLVLSAPSQGQPSIRKKLSNAFTVWFGQKKPAARDNLKMLINSLLYLRTQTLPNERSTADRSQWLEIDYLKAATAANNCGMFKTALLFTEEFYSESGQSKSSRRSSFIHEPPEMPTDILLTIFENIDDPDLYYGVQQAPSLSAIHARLDYEKDGPKSLAFRGAQYDSHVRNKAPESARDVQSLVNALDVLSLSGLSNSLLQAQPTIGMSSETLDAMFRTARKLEQWDIPVPNTRSSNSATIYKAFQAINTAPDYPTVSRAINEGLDCTMTHLIREDLSAKALHDSLQTLAALVEMDEVFSSQGSEQFEELVARFRGRETWMKIGRFEDINQILSCRGTTLSTLSQQPRLHKIVNIRAVDTRLVEVQTALLASGLTRAHNSLQDSLSLATSLIDLITPCRDVNLNVDFAIQLEAANALWDQGEIASSIGMLLSLEKEKLVSFQKQELQIGRSKILSQLGSRVSDARLEKPDKILENYLKPALNELKGKNDGIEAGQVYHQFAVFCDQQLQDVDGLEDLDRLKKLSKMKEDEVRELSKLMNTSPHNDRSKVKGHLQKAKTWLKLDQDELHRHMASRDEFLRQSLENYLLALSASDEHDNNALRFTALWLQHSETQLANEAVAKHIVPVASRKFAPLMNQLTSRLQDSTVKFHRVLFSLVLRIAIDHPFHGMYQIYAGASTRANAKDETAVLRTAAAVKLTKELTSHPQAGPTWNSIHSTNKVYCQLAAEKDDSRYKSGKKIPLKESLGGTRLNSAIAKYPIPAPTMQIDFAADMDYSKVPVMAKFEPVMSIASGVSAPKIITAIASNGLKYKQLVKGGNDDLRQDAIMEQVFEQVSELLRTNRQTRQRNLRIRTYKVLPLTSSAGIIEFVPNTVPLHEYLIPAHTRYYPKDYNGNKCRMEISEVQNQGHSVRVARFRKVTENFHPVMRYFFTEQFTDPDEWFVKRLAYTRSTAAISILGHVLGLGDRHGHNILLDAQSGEVVHIDLGVAFEMGRVLPIPELVPFRLTRDIVDGMGITKTEGVFRRCCEFTLEALRKEAYSIMTILDVLRYDPLYSWSISPVRLAKLQEGQSAAPEHDAGKTAKEVVNEPGEADRALTVVNKKLSKTLSVTATVNDLINQAKDETNLAVLYSGWAAYA